MHSEVPQKKQLAHLHGIARTYHGPQKRARTKERGMPRTQFFSRMRTPALGGSFSFCMRYTYTCFFFFFWCCDHQMRLGWTKQTPRRMSLQLERLHLLSDCLPPTSASKLFVAEPGRSRGSIAVIIHLDLFCLF